MCTENLEAALRAYGTNKKLYLGYFTLDEEQVDDLTRAIYDVDAGRSFGCVADRSLQPFELRRVRSPETKSGVHTLATFKLSFI